MIEFVIRQLLYFIKILCDQLCNKDTKRELTGGDASSHRHLQVKTRYLACKYMNIINKGMTNRGLQTPSWQCRREDASPPISLCSIHLPCDFDWSNGAADKIGVSICEVLPFSSGE